jgi:serine protease AprX
MSEIEEARARVENTLGADFASKASDALCLALRGAPATRELLAQQQVDFTSVIVEFDRSLDLVVRAGAMLRDAASGGALKQIDAAIGHEAIAPGVPRLAGRQLLRQQLVAQLRDQFLRGVSTVRDRVERSTTAVRSTTREAQEAKSLTELCWLNKTMRARSPHVVLAEIASDPSVEWFDLPRVLQPEMDVSTAIVGAPAFRTNTGLDGTGVIVAVIDSEVARAHPAFQDRVVHQENFTNETWGHPDDHGTAVAGIVAARPDAAAFAGIAPGATIYNYKVLATSRLLNADNFGGSLALQRAVEDGAMVANCSWGAGPASDGTSPEARACNAAWQLGMVIVKSAGNQGPNRSTLTTPADADGVIVVGATDREGKALQDYSSRGPTSDGRARPHLLAPGGSLTDPLRGLLVGGGIGAIGAGTSYAAPHVAGAAALLLEQNPNFEPDDVRDVLLRACRALDGVPAELQGSGVLHL